MEKEYKYYVSGNAPELYLTDTWFGLLYYNQEEALEIPKRYPYKGEWGSILSTNILRRSTYPLPIKLDMVWLSVIERKFYSIEAELPVEKIEQIWMNAGADVLTHIVVGMAPYGGVALWLVGYQKSYLIAWLQASGFKVNYQDYMPNGPMKSLKDYCDFYIDNDLRVKENLKNNGLPPQHLFDKYMQQFTYRYLLLFEHWDKDKNDWRKYEKEETIPELDYIEEALFDGTYDKLHDGGLMNYHQAGKPKKLAVKWHIKKSEYTVYFWFEDEEIRVIFDRFYGAHPDTKTDFMIRIDSEKNKYELALFRYGLKEPQVINESAYQLIVFKNKFENFRSENYNQSRGAWVW